MRRDLQLMDLFRYLRREEVRSRAPQFEALRRPTGTSYLGIRTSDRARRRRRAVGSSPAGAGSDGALRLGAWGLPNAHAADPSTPADNVS
jgi:hypothetical protein